MDSCLLDHIICIKGYSESMICFQQNDFFVDPKTTCLNAAQHFRE